MILLRHVVRQTILSCICLFCFTLTDIQIAYAKPSQLVIVTSYSEDIYTYMISGFQELYPSIKVKVRNKKTAAAISFVQETADRPADLFWASSPDAFELLKSGGFLKQYYPVSPGIAEQIKDYPIHDPDGFYTGFAIFGLGIMFNRQYLLKHNLKPPTTWQDLVLPEYYRHIGMSTPSRSGTTHMAIESILQSQGWEKGWATILRVGGNLATITARSYGVPDGVKNRRFGIGIVIDFFGLSLKSSGFPISFVYPPGTALLPANIAIIKGAENETDARKFIHFLISKKGQQMLFAPNISRLPVMPSIYDKAPEDYPDPFLNGQDFTLHFDTTLSRVRYHLINSMFDRMVTYRKKALNYTWKMIYTAEILAEEQKNKSALKLISEAKKIATRVPVSNQQAEDNQFISIFKRRRPGKPLPEKQVELERSWDAFSRMNLEWAQELVSQAVSEIKKSKK